MVLGAPDPNIQATGDTHAVGINVRVGVTDTTETVSVKKKAHSGFRRLNLLKGSVSLTSMTSLRTSVVVVTLRYLPVQIAC